VASVFEKNIQRALSLAQLPEFIARSTKRITEITLAASENILKSAPPEILTGSHADIRAYIEPRFADEMLHLDELRGHTPQALQEESDASSNILKALLVVDSKHPVLDGMESLYISLIVNIWTSFEAMSGDLWEKALNFHPQSLAALKGSETRILRQAGLSKQVRSDEETASKGVITISDLTSLTRGNYELADKMGTLLRRRFRFTILEGIRAAYSEAFCKDCERIDECLSSHSLDALAALRNVVVHKAGIADSEYTKKAKAFAELPQTNELQPIVVSAELTRDLINPVIQRGSALLLAVDEWLTNNPIANGQPTT
jgi:hypothetical protein